MKLLDGTEPRKLSDTTIRGIKPTDKTQSFADGYGLRLEVPKDSSTGYWRYRFRFAGKYKTLAIGAYPKMSLAMARKLHREAYNQVSQGVDPALERSKKRQAQKQEYENTFEVVANKWFSLYIKDKKSASHQKRTRGLLNNHILPYIGKRPVSHLTKGDVSGVLERMQAAGIYSSGTKARQVVRSILRYASNGDALDTTKRIELTEAMENVIDPPKPLKECNFAAVTEPDKLRPILLAIDAVPSHVVVKTALQLAPMLLARPIEICAAEWSEVNFTQQQLEIDAQRMKLGEPHIIPLASQAMELLHELHAITGHSKYVFPSFRRANGGANRHITTESLTVALRSAGVPKEAQTVHGFRATARTMLAQEETLEYRVDWIEHQLANVKPPHE